MKKSGVLLLVMLAGCMLNQSLAFEFDDITEGIEIHGFISQGFLKSYENNITVSTKNGSFQFNEFGLNFSTELSERLRAGIQLFGRDFGDFGNNSLRVDWAYGDYRWKDWLGVRAGKFKLSFGLYNDTRDLDMVRTFIFLPDSLYDEKFRDIYNALYGLEGYGHISLARLGSLNYQAQYGESNITQDSVIEKEFDAWFDPVSVEIQDVSAIGLEWETPLEGLRIKSWFATYDFEMRGTTKDLPEFIEFGIPAGTPWKEMHHNDTFTTISAEYARERFVLMAEYGMSEDQDQEREEGYYIGTTFRVTDWLELGMYYSVFYDDADDKDGKKLETEGKPDYYAWYKDFVMTARCDINDSWTFKLEGHAINGAASLWEADNPDGITEDSFLVAVKTTFNF